MTTPSRVTETVPDSIRARGPITIAQIVDGERARAPIAAVPEQSRSGGLTFTPGLVHPAGSR